MQWDYIKGSESDFEGAPDWATIIFCSNHDNYLVGYCERFEKGQRYGLMGYRDEENGTLYSWLKNGHIIAQRQPAAQTRRNDELLTDAVNSPKHYADSSIECIDAIEASMSREEFQGYLKGNVQKYVWRYRHKGGVEDLKKSQWYANRLISNLELFNGK